MPYVALTATSDALPQSVTLPPRGQQACCCLGRAVHALLLYALLLASSMRVWLRSCIATCRGLTQQ